MALADNLLGYWGLNESSGDAIDAVAGNNGPVHALVVRPSDGIIDSGYFFPEDGQSVKIIDTGGLYNLTGDFGVSFWYKYNTPVYSFTSPVGNLNTSINEGFGILFFDTGVIRVNVRGLYIIDSANAHDLYNDSWHHIVVTRLGTEIYIYVDGVLDITTWISSDSVVSTTDFKIGSSGVGGLLIGHIDEVGIWDRHLTQDDVTLLYASGVGNTYPFSEPFTARQIKFALVGGYWDDNDTWNDEDNWWED